jgi:hypothetical protein
MPDAWEFGTEFASQGGVASPCAGTLRKLTDLCDSGRGRRAGRR